MARSFTKNVANYVALGTGELSAELDSASDVSFACRFNPTSWTQQANRDRIITVIIADTNINGLVFGFDVDTASQYIWGGGRSVSGDGFQNLEGLTDLGTGSWYSGGIVLDIDGDAIRLYLNGAQDNSSGVTFGNASWTDANDQTYNDAFNSNCSASSGAPTGTDSQFDGDVAEIGLWAGDIGLAGFASYEAGKSPLEISPDLLVAYWPVLGRTSPIIEVVSKIEGTINGTVAWAAHPPVFYPAAPMIHHIPTAGIAALEINHSPGNLAAWKTGVRILMP